MNAIGPQARAPSLSSTVARRPGSLQRLFSDQLGYALRDLWRTRIAFIFTFLFPLTFLVVIGALVGNDTISTDSHVRVMQFAAPSAAVMGALFGAFPTVASSLAEARERGILKRLHGTPLPGWVYLAARICAAVLFAVASLSVMLFVGIVAYDVQVQWRTMPATVVTVLAAVTCFACAGVALAGVARSSAVAQAVSIGTAVVLSFLSGVMGVGDMPDWADRTAQLFPLKPFNDALGEQFDPFTAGSGWDFAALVVMGAWTAGASVIAVLTFRWDPVPAERSRVPAGASPPAGVITRIPLDGGGAPAPAPGRGEATGRPGWWSQVWDQARWATQSALRDIGWVFFTIAMPVGLYAFNASVIGGSPASTDVTPPLGLQSATGLIAWSVVVTALVNVPEAIARARDRGILKRLRGTPLRVGTYLSGRFISALMLVLVTAALILLVGSLWFELRVAWGGLVVAVVAVTIGTASLMACGMVLVSLLPSSKAVTAVGLGITLPLAFFSDVFVIGSVPAWMSTVGSAFPLKHLANSLSYALDPAGSTVSWLGLVVMTAWLVPSALLSGRIFRWSVRS